MRSKVAKRISDKTSELTEEKVTQYTEELVKVKKINPDYFLDK